MGILGIFEGKDVQCGASLDVEVDPGGGVGECTAPEADAVVEACLC